MESSPNSFLICDSTASSAVLAFLAGSAALVSFFSAIFC